MMTDTKSLYLFERMNLSESELDAASFVARGVTLIKPGFSSNTDKAGRPRYYSKEVLTQAARVFEGTRAYRNHPRRSDEKDLPERDVRDQVGYYENVTAAEDGTLKGDLRVVGEAQAWLWPMIEETKRKPDYVELSINALGQTRIGEAEGRKAVVIESIKAANSVDVVTTGAAGGSFAGALLQSDGETFTRDLLEAMPFAQWREARPEYVEQLKGEWKTVRESEAIKAMNANIKDSFETVTRLQEANRALEAELVKYRLAETADRLLAESALPHPLRNAVRPELLEAADEAGMRKVIEREKAKHAVTPKAPVPVEGAGQRTRANVREVAKPANPAASLFGLKEDKMAIDGESGTQYAERMKRIREAR